MKLKGIWNRFIFLIYKRQLATCGKGVIFEMPYEIEGAKHIYLGNAIRIKPRLHIAAIDRHNGVDFDPKIIIGNNVSINYDVHIACINRIEIGEGTLLGSKIFITDHFHGDTSYESLKTSPSQRILSSKGPVIIGKNVWIGEGVAIMPGVTIGDNSIIGANSVVTQNIQPFSVVGGCPAREIKKYSVSCDIF